MTAPIANAPASPASIEIVPAFESATLAPPSPRADPDPQVIHQVLAEARKKLYALLAEDRRTGLRPP